MVMAGTAITGYVTDRYATIAAVDPVTAQTLATRDFAMDIAAATVTQAAAAGLIKSAIPSWQLPFSSSDYVTNTEVAVFSELSYELTNKWK